MKYGKRTVIFLMIVVITGIAAFLPIAASAAGLSSDIEAAKAAIDKARLAGADTSASNDLKQAKSWLEQAEKEYAQSQSFWSRGVKLITSDEKKRKEIQYLAAMARIHGQIAEAKSLQSAVSLELTDTQKQLADYQKTLDVLKKKSAEAAQARKIKAQAETQQKELEQEKKKAALLESKKAKELEEARRKVAELEALKRKELEEVSSKGQLLASQRAKEEEELKVLQQKMAYLEKIKAMTADAAKISDVNVIPVDTGVLITAAAANIFSAKNDIIPRGKSLLDQVAGYLEKYPAGAVMISCYTDNAGKADKNRLITEKRAQKVKGYLVDFHNIAADRIAIQGLGSTQPVADNNTAAGRALNRRVEIAVAVGSNP
ncbi:MAG: hypothetical protein EG826_09995 [Deltaproteobacteria bacterium]|nr:hypothetical protein [Deltaproteobacteria bacterium]